MPKISRKNDMCCLPFRLSMKMLRTWEAEASAYWNDELCSALDRLKSLQQYLHKDSIRTLFSLSSAMEWTLNPIVWWYNFPPLSLYINEKMATNGLGLKIVINHSAWKFLLFDFLLYIKNVYAARYSFFSPSTRIWFHCCIHAAARCGARRSENSVATVALSRFLAVFPSYFSSSPVLLRHSV